jgi:uncharacterized membrane protein YhaH (DUF805 family)
VTTTPPPTRTTTGSRSRPTRRARLVAVVGATAAALGVWALAGGLLGVDLTVRTGSDAAVQHLGPVAVTLVGVLVGLAGWGTLALAERRTPARARTGWMILAVAVLAVSLAGPLTSATTPAATVALLGMHLAVAGVLIPALTRTATRA